MKELLEYIVKNLVTNPDAVIVEEDNQDGNVNLYLTVHPEDMGIIIGKGGQTIHAIRKVLTVRAISENVRINLQLNEPEGGKPKEESGQATGDSEQSEKTEKEAKEPEIEETEDSKEEKSTKGNKKKKSSS